MKVLDIYFASPSCSWGIGLEPGLCHSDASMPGVGNAKMKAGYYPFLVPVEATIATNLSSWCRSGIGTNKWLGKD